MRILIFNKKKKHNFLIFFVFFCFILFMSKTTFADGGYLDNVVMVFDTHLKNIFNELQNAGIRLFWILAAISVVWTGCELIMTKGDLTDFFAQFLKLIVVIGFFYYLVSGGGIKLCVAFLESVQQLGGSTMGKDGVTASGLVDTVIGLNEYIGYEWLSRPIYSLSLFILFIFILLASLVLIVNVLLLTITALICMYAGVIVLGFGSLGWTREIAISYFRQVANVCLQLLVVLTLFAVAQSFISITIGLTTTTQECTIDLWGGLVKYGICKATDNAIGSTTVGGLGVTELVKIFSLMFLLAICATKIPPLVGNMIGGTGTGGMSFSAGQAIATVAAATAATVAVAAGGVGLAAGAAKASGAATKAGATTAGKGGDDTAKRAAAMGANGISGGGGGAKGGGGGSAFGGGSGGQTTSKVSSGGGATGGGATGGGGTGGGESASSTSSSGSTGGGESSNDNTPASADEGQEYNFGKEAAKYAGKVAKDTAVFAKDMTEISTNDNASASNYVGHYSSGRGVGSNSNNSGGSAFPTEVEPNKNPNSDPNRSGNDPKKG